MMRSPTRCTFAALGTDAVVLTAEPGSIDAATDAVRDEVAAIDRTCSRFRSDSDLSRVNDAEGVAVAVDALFIEALEVAIAAARRTGGVVDPTLGEALLVLGYDRDFAELAPEGPPVVHAARVPGWKVIDIDANAGTVRVPSGTSLDLGATAKAFAADRAAHAAAEASGGPVLVSLGGDLSIAGDPLEGGWAVHVADRQGGGLDQPGQTVVLRDGGLATSSTTVRHWVRGGVPQHHLIDPDTGRPAPTVWRTASVAAATCVDANVASTAAMIMGEDAPGWLRKIGLPARLVRNDGQALVLNGWEAEES